MNPQVRDALRALIVKHGPEICSDARRVESLLKDLCPQDRREVAVLVAAVRSRVPDELARCSDAGLVKGRLANLAQRLEDESGLSHDAAAWSVDSWALALGTISEPSFTAAPSAARPAPAPHVPTPPPPPPPPRPHIPAAPGAPPSGFAPPPVAPAPSAPGSGIHVGVVLVVASLVILAGFFVVAQIRKGSGGASSSHEIEQPSAGTSVAPPGTWGGPATSTVPDASPAPGPTTLEESYGGTRVTWVIPAGWNLRAKTTVDPSTDLHVQRRTALRGQALMFIEISYPAPSSLELYPQQTHDTWTRKNYRSYSRIRMESTMLTGRQGLLWEYLLRDTEAGMMRRINRYAVVGNTVVAFGVAAPEAEFEANRELFERALESIAIQ